MNLQRHRSETPDVNLTPLIDVVFLLLIFFMVSTTFKDDHEIKIDLPEASAKAAKHKDKPLEIRISSDGRYFVNGKEVVNKRLDTLKRVIRKIARGYKKDAQVIIRTDRKATHESFIRAMDAVKQLGFRKISIPVAPGSK